MSKLKLSLALAALALAALAVTGCKPTDDSVSVKERMEMFIEDANAGAYGSLKDHTHPAATSYNLADSAFWSGRLAAYIPLGGLSINGTTATATGNGGTPTFTFTLVEDGSDVYKIRTIDRGGTTIFN